MQPLKDPENYRRAFLNPPDNTENLSAEFLASLENLSEKQRKRFYEGVYVDEIDCTMDVRDNRFRPSRARGYPRREACGGGPPSILQALRGEMIWRR
jgi:hypothetical protein